MRFIIDSWIYQVERWFAEFSLESSKGVQTSTKQLESDIRFTRPSNGITTTITISCGGISPTSSTPTISADA